MPSIHVSKNIFTYGKVKRGFTSNPVPHQVGAQIDASVIASAHARKERHVFAHHREIVARIVEVEDRIVRIIVFIFICVCVFWKQVHADRCAVHVRLRIFGQRRNAVHSLILRIHLGRGHRRIHAPHNGIPPKDAETVEPRRDRNVGQHRRILFDLSVAKHRLVVHGGLHVVLVVPRPKRLPHDFGTEWKLRVTIRVKVVHVSKRVQAVANERVKPVGVARNAAQNGVDRERHGIVHVNHDDVFSWGTLVPR